MSRRDSERQTRRELIVDATEQLFRKNGFEATQMDDIARAAEFSKTTVYNYFKSKDELAMAVYQRLHARKMTFVKQAMEPYGDAVNKLRAFARAYYSFFIEHPDYLRFQLHWDYRGLERSRIRPELAAQTSDFLASDVEYFSAVVRQGIAEGTLRDGLDIEKTLDLFYLTLRSVMNQILISNDEARLGSFIASRKEDYTRFLELFIRSLERSPSA